MSDYTSTNPSIFLRLREDDRATQELSWHEFYARYAPIIAGFARRRGLDGADVDDAVQAVLLGFFKASDRFEYDPAKGRFRSYLKTATVRAIQRQRQSGHDAFSFDDGRDSHLNAGDPELDADWERAWERGVLQRAMLDVKQRVDPRTFEAFEYAAIRKVPAAEIAKRLEMSEDSVRQAKSRVTRQISDVVKKIREREG